MTKKHFEKAANLVRFAPIKSKAEKLRMAEQFATFFRGENPRFDKNRFIEACKIA